MDKNAPRTIGELAMLTGVHKSTLHYWIARGHLRPESRPTALSKHFYYVASLNDVEAAKLRAKAARLSRHDPGVAAVRGAQDSA